jgi:hypothetical protein
MAPDDMKKTALITKTGLYDWTVMPFGLKNATSTFTRTMSEVFKDLGSAFLKVFVDDLNVHSETWDDHIRHLGAVLSKLREVNLKLNPSKCCFAAKSVTFLGHVVNREGIRPDPGKVEVVLHFPTPKNVTGVRSFLGLTGYYRKYIKGYSNLAGPLFELTRKDTVFAWNEKCEQAYQALKAALVDAPVLTRPDFRRTFWLNVDWSPRGVGAVLSQKEGKFEKVVAYASKSLTDTQKRFHPMEGECYALIWGIMHFRQYLHMKHFILRTDHKPLEWLATISDTHGRRGRWVGMLQDFSFKIVHRPGLRHMNADTLSRNPVGLAEEDEDFGEEIRDTTGTHPDALEEGAKLLYALAGKNKEWMGIKRKDRRYVQHDACCFGINHQMNGHNHQLFMLGVESEEEGSEESVPNEEVAPTPNVPVQEDEELVVLKRRRPRYYDRRQQLELVLAAQELSEFGDPDLSPTELDEEEGHGVKPNCADIWQDVECLRLIREGTVDDALDYYECRRIRKRASNYCWKEQKLFFKTLLVPKPEERTSLVKQMHEDLGHFGEQRTLAEIRRRYFWHSRTTDVKAMVRGCQQCQLVKNSGSIRSGDEQLKSIPICDLFHRVALDTAGPLPEIRSGNKYILVAIDHYSKWCEAKAMVDHGAKTTAKFLEDDIICRFGVPKFILTDNGGEWAAEFDVMCKDYAIQHQQTAPHWPQCNGMAEHMIKTIKHGLTVLATTLANTECWDEQLAKVLFGYRCGIQASTKFSPFMILTGRTPRLRADNYLQTLIAETDEGGSTEDVAAQFSGKG